MTQEIQAPLAGKIFKVNIREGQVIEEDEEAFVMEAMKMETPIFATCSGTVKSVKVKEGDDADEDDVLAVIDD